MQVLSMIWGILAMLGMIIAFFPCLGSLNWLNIPFSAVGLVVSVVALATTREPNRGGSIVGVVCCSFAIVIGLIRLAAGGGIF